MTHLDLPPDQANELIATVPLAIRDRFLMCLTPLRTNSPMQVRGRFQNFHCQIFYEDFYEDFSPPIFQFAHFRVAVDYFSVTMSNSRNQYLLLDFIFLFSSESARPWPTTIFVPRKYFIPRKYLLLSLSTGALLSAVREGVRAARSD